VPEVGCTENVAALDAVILSEAEAELDTTPCTLPALIVRPAPSVEMRELAFVIETVLSVSVRLPPPVTDRVPAPNVS
jgi:hypothetical protein